MNPTIVRLAFSALLGRRRFWALVALPVAIVALALGLSAIASDADVGWGLVASTWLPIVVPVLALLAASAVLGPEIDDGSVVYLLAKPVSRHTVVRSKFVVAALTTTVLVTVPVLLLGLIQPPVGDGRPGESALGLVLGAGVAGLAYVALFLAMTASLTRSVTAAVLYVFVWEQVICGFLSGARTLSVSAWGTRIAESVDAGIDGPDVALWWAWLAAVLTVVLGIFWAGDRLRSYSIRNDD